MLSIGLRFFPAKAGLKVSGTYGFSLVFFRMFFSQPRGAAGLGEEAWQKELQRSTLEAEAFAVT